MQPQLEWQKITVIALPPDLAAKIETALGDGTARFVADPGLALVRVDRTGRQPVA